MANGAIASWSASWRESWKAIRPSREQDQCPHARRYWQNLRGRRHAVLLDRRRVCVEECLETALIRALERSNSPARHVPSHRIPLGLILLSRHQVTQNQLLAALEAQRAGGRGRIGDWLQSMGAVTEQQVTAALARQWSCPVLRSDLPLPSECLGRTVPLALLQGAVMVPLTYIESASTLHVAFGEGIDYTVLYAIEQMMGIRTEPCMATPSFVHSRLEHLARRREDTEFVFDRISDVAEFARIVRSYSVRTSASEVRLAHCGSFHWVRLLQPSRPSMDLLMRFPQPPLPAFSGFSFPSLG